MALEGLAAVQARIAELRHPPVEAPTARAAPTGIVGTGGTAADFASVLAAALGATGAGSTALTAGSPLGALLSSHGAGALSTTGAAVASTATNAEGVPLALAAYGNGRIPHDQLVPISGTQHRLWAPAAAAFERLRAAAAADGVTIGITDSYRDYDTQVDLARRKGLYRNGGLAATPGTSDHGWGKSLDLDLDPAALSWMRVNAARFGFVEDVPREPWHWTFKPAG
jgi:D-alanyl-D-alanine carboxypeptidase